MLKKANRASFCAGAVLVLSTEAQPAGVGWGGGRDVGGWEASQDFTGWMESRLPNLKCWMTGNFSRHCRRGGEKRKKKNKSKFLATLLPSYFYVHQLLQNKKKSSGKVCGWHQFKFVMSYKAAFELHSINV